VPDGIDAAVNPVQPPGRGTLLRCPRTEPERPKLPERNDSVLPPSELGNRHVDGGWLENANVWFAKADHPPDPRAQRVTALRASHTKAFSLR
jgi:hypothetical protein